MNPFTPDAARLLDADFLDFVASAGWGVNIGLALFFLIPRRGATRPMADRSFWLNVAAAFFSVLIVCTSRLLDHYFEALPFWPHRLSKLSQIGAAGVVLCTLAVLPHPSRIGSQAIWRWCTAIPAIVIAVLVIEVPALAAGWWLEAGAASMGVSVVAGGWLVRRRSTEDAGRFVIHLVLGATLLVLAVAVSARHTLPELATWPEGRAAVHGAAQDWNGALLAATAIGAFIALWRKYLAACTLPRIRARRGIFGVRPILVLPLLEAIMLSLGSVWFVASSRQAENYAARRLQAEVATVVASLDTSAQAGARDAGEIDWAIRRALERVVRRSASFIAAVAWDRPAPGESRLIAAVSEGDTAVPFDAQRLLPRADEIDQVRGGGVVRWVHGTTAYARAIVIVPIGTGGAGPLWFLSIAVDSHDLASLVVTHRLQALAILSLAIIVVAIVVVYTIRTLNEAELRLLKESAESENNGRNAFLAMVSHEIRTPLQSVLGYAELAESTNLDEQAARHVHAIRTQGAILLRIVQDILDFSALRGGGLALNPEVVSLRELLDDVHRGLAARAQAKGIVFSAEIDGDVPPWVMVDRVRLAQVLLNLAVNAVKFTDRGGVRLAASCGGVADGRAAIEILVSDTGAGINAMQMRRLFEPFRKMRDDDTPGGGGVGLGLAISRQIVELLGGTITAESVDGEGTTFHVGLNLPTVAAPMGAAEHGEGVPAGSPIPSLAGLEVLLIDDNPHVRELLRDFLCKLGADVCVRPNGMSALEAMQQGRFDVVLLDLRLPDMPGAELAARLRGMGPSATDPWIVGISAGVSDAEIQQTLERGVNDFMLKPVSMAGLAETIRMSPAAARISPESPCVEDAKGGGPAEQRAAFLAELEPVFDRLDDSCRNELGSRLGAEAHYLANGCMVTGFDEGVSLCRDIEELAVSGDFGAAREKIGMLRNYFAAAAPGAGTASGT